MTENINETTAFVAGLTAGMLMAQRAEGVLAIDEVEPEFDDEGIATSSVTFKGVESGERYRVTVRTVGEE